MMNSRLSKWLTCAASFAVLSLGACGDDDDGGTEETTRFEVRVENVAPQYDFLKSGEITAPIMASESFTTFFTAPPGTRLSFASMFVPSNDYFFAPDAEGIALWTGEGADARRVEGDVTDQVMIWDAGTEENQPLGRGPDQVQNQGQDNVGDRDSDTNVRLANDSSIPAVTNLIRVELAAGNTDTEFILTITNISSITYTLPDNSQTPVVLSPGVWVVHDEPAPLFESGTPDRVEGLESIAEDGNRMALSDLVKEKTGVNVPISPGVFAVHDDNASPLFEKGKDEFTMGLEALAEDGDPQDLSRELASDDGVRESGVFDRPITSTATGELSPGESPPAAYSFDVRAGRGDHLSLAAMYVASNDLFLAFGDEGIALFDGDTPIEGDVSSELEIWDLGTEVNQEPGVGLDQAAHQGRPNTGSTESENVDIVSDDFNYPNASSVMRVTITPLE